MRTLSILSGLALTSFAFSGLWIYVQMYRRRARLAADGNLPTSGRGNWRVAS